MSASYHPVPQSYSEPDSNIIPSSQTETESLLSYGPVSERFSADLGDRRLHREDTGLTVKSSENAIVGEILNLQSAVDVSNLASTIEFEEPPEIENPLESVSPIESISAEPESSSLPSREDSHTAMTGNKPNRHSGRASIVGIRTSYSASEIDDQQHGNAIPRSETRQSDIFDSESGYVATKVASNIQAVELYCPFFLRKSVLLAFALAESAMIVLLVTLYAISQRNQGLGAPSQRLHLLWKYGPTAIPVFISALWGQVELRTKQYLPWSIMYARPAKSKDTISLDYVEPMNVISLFTSVKSRHWPITFAIVGGMLLNLSVVFSSGLFSLDIIHVEKPTPDLIASYDFDVSRFNLSSSDGAPYSKWYAIQKFNLSYPLGTTATRAYQTFNLTRPPHDFDTSAVSMNGTAGQFSASMSCQPYINRLNYTVTENGYPTTQGLLEYSGAQVNVTEIDLGFFTLSIVSPTCSTTPRFSLTKPGQMYFVDCKSGSTTPSWGRSSLDALQNRTESQDQIMFAFWGIVENQAQFSAVLCQPSYNYGQSSFIMPYAGQVNPPLLGPPTTGKLPNLSSFNVMDAVLASMMYLPSDLKTAFQAPGIGDYFFTALNVTNPHTATWLDTEKLSKSIQDVYAGFSAQVARQYFVVPSNTSIHGNILGDTSRLIMSRLSTALIIVTLGLSMIAALLLVFFAPRRVTSRDPTTIGGLSTILARSPEYIKQSYDHKMRINNVTSHLYQTEVLVDASNRRFHIDTTENIDPKAEKATIEDLPTIGKWYKPYAFTLWNKSLIIVLLAALIAILEVLHRLSLRHEGLAAVPDNKYVQLAWVYVPIATVVGIGLLLTGFDFTTQILQPYMSLQRGGASAKTSVLDGNLGRLAVHRLWNGLTSLQLTVITSTVSVLLVHVLTIAISGLYVAEVRPQSTDVIFTQVDRLDGSQVLNDSGMLPTDWTGNFALVGNERQSLPGLVLQYNVPLPLWTTTEFALPRGEVPALGATNTDNITATKQILQIQSQALRGNLNCSLLPDSEIVFKGKGFASSPFGGTYGKPQFDEEGLVIQTSIPKICGDPSLGADLAAVQYSFAPGYVGQVRYGSSYANHVNTLEPTCPPFVMIFGYVDPAIEDDITNANISVAWCYPFYENVNINLNVSMPDYNIRSAVADESTKTVQTLPNLWTIISQTFSDLPSSKSITAAVSMQPFFRSLLFSGSKPLEVESIGRKDKVTDVLDSMQKAYRTLSAQTANIYLRSAPISPPLQLPGVLTSTSRQRLIQSTIPTRILQVSLAIVLICMVLAFHATRRFSKVLRESPTCIAAVASLLAESRILDQIPEGAEWLSDDELQKLDIFNDPQGFSLKYWGSRVVENDENQAALRFGIDAESLHRAAFGLIDGNRGRCWHIGSEGEDANISVLYSTSNSATTNHPAIQQGRKV
ncbi:hypothetical protein VTL71DRAFT_74 [Oculimacula yallundae]|uniref:Uncharacterized protein n=1 Tax=Oculimacula yallundae TaxID=86028 RepID=A0ABR4CZ13_9HELO